MLRPIKDSIAVKCLFIPFISPRKTPVLRVEDPVLRGVKDSGLCLDELRELYAVLHTVAAVPL